MMGRICWLVVCLLASVTATGAGERGTVVVAELEGGQVVYEIDGKKERGLDEAIEVLRERVNRTGVLPQDDTAFVLASSELTIKQVMVLRAGLQAYGFVHLFCYTYHDDKARLIPVSFSSKVIRYTKDGAELLRTVDTKN